MPNPPITARRHEDYTVAIICAIGFERDAVRYMLDHEHPRLATRQGDSNMYVLGELSGHNVALACLPGSQGKSAAATVATNMEHTFPATKWRFLIGIGGGVPSDKHDVRLGDVVVSMPQGPYGGVVQYDLGKDTVDDFQLKGLLSAPPTLLRSAVELMRSDHLVTENKVGEFLVQLLQKGPRLSKYQRPSAGQDVLFDADYPHVEGRFACENCDLTKAISRQPRQASGPEVHYGLIASGDRVMRSAIKRTAAANVVGDILCFEMEAAGIATEFPCIVIRGISDYADSHKNDIWQHYAAAVAAATSKELLSYITLEHPFGDIRQPTQSAQSSLNNYGPSDMLNAPGGQVSEEDEGPPTPLPPITTEVELMPEIDPRYRVQHSAKFMPGEIFKVHWSEPRGAGNDYAAGVSGKQVTQNRFETEFLIGIRRFIVFSNDLGHSTCVPIRTYGGRACKKKGVKPTTHGIIYERGRNARMLDKEPSLGFPPVEAQMHEEDERLSKESRINYSKLVTVEHTVEVFFIGSIVDDHWELVNTAVNQCWEQKNRQNRHKGTR